MDLYQQLLEINELAAAMTIAHDLKELQQCLYVAYSQWMPDDSVCLCLMDGNHYSRTQVSGFRIFAGEGAYPLEHGLVGKSLQSGAPMLIPDLAASARLASAPVAEAFECCARSFIVLPLKGGDRVLGCLEIASPRPERFSPLDYHLSLLLAAHVSSALQNILTRQQLAASNEQLRAQEKRLTELNHLLQEQALTDDLTGLFNRRRLLMQLDFEIARARRYGGDLSCLMIDIDGFKEANDTHGHPKGDEVLSQVGDILHRFSRVTDFVARYGGDEFTVVLPQTNAMGALRAAEKLRCRVKERIFSLPPDLQLLLTISVGSISCNDPASLNAHEIISLADKALYQAKRSGGDRVCCSVHGDWPNDRVKNLSNH